MRPLRAAPPARFRIKFSSSYAEVDVSTNRPMTALAPGRVARPIGPGSLLWRYAGDHRLAFSGLSAGLLQLMHPAIGAGVAEHSDFFTDPWGRIIRSIPQILGVVYLPNPEALGRRIRGYHRTITGFDAAGRRYRALEPSTFWWAHATFQYATEMVADRFDRRHLSQHDREELYLDGVEWYRRYGVSMKPVPANRAGFAVEWDRHVDEVLEMTPAAAKAVDMALHDRDMELKFLPSWTRFLQPHVITPLLRLGAFGGLPARLRRRLDIPWGLREEADYQLLRYSVASLWRWLPARARYGPVASAGYDERVRRDSHGRQALLSGA
jgi:uncharacterized protein (DUF2236 family)